MENIPISSYEDWQEISTGLLQKKSRIDAYNRKVNQKRYAMENAELQQALRVAMLYEKCGELDIAQTILATASKLFIWEQSVKKINRAWHNAQVRCAGKGREI
jgi:hypothetical protein